MLQTCLIWDRDILRHRECPAAQLPQVHSDTQEGPPCWASQLAVTSGDGIWDCKQVRSYGVQTCTNMLQTLSFGLISPPPSNSSKMVLHLKAYAKKTPEMKPKNGLHKRLLWSFFFLLFGQSCANFITNSPCATPPLHPTSDVNHLTSSTHTSTSSPPLLAPATGTILKNVKQIQTMCVTIVINCHSSGEVDNLLTTCWQNDSWGWTCLPSVENSASASSTSAEASAWPGGGQCATHWEGSGYDMIWLWFCLIMFGFNQIILIYLNLFCLHLDLVS